MRLKEILSIRNKILSMPTRLILKNKRAYEHRLYHLRRRLLFNGISRDRIKEK